MEVKNSCEAVLPHNVETYGHFHALIVHNSKEHCKKKPNCTNCPLEKICKKIFLVDIMKHYFLLIVDVSKIILK